MNEKWTTHTARVTHYCWGCSKHAILPGQTYQRYVSFEDGSPVVVKRCEACIAEAKRREEETLEWFKKHRNLPFLQIGMLVEVDGKMGKVAGTDGDGLKVEFDGDRFDRCHPHYETRYFDADGKVLADYTAAGSKEWMGLPDGMTCGDCVKFSWCRDMRGREADETECLWQPIKFEAKEATA